MSRWLLLGLVGLVGLVGLLWPARGHAADCASNLLIVLDRSCSMQTAIKDPMTGMSKPKWDIATAAINKLASTYRGRLRLGLAMFPDKAVTTPRCVQGANAIPPALNNEMKIADLLAATRPNNPCVTNIDEAMRQARDEPAFQDMSVRSFALLLTDGQQSGDCNGGTAKADPLTVGYIKQLYDRKVPTYVVGFAAAASARSLNQFADAGGLPNPVGPDHFYLANSQSELDKILDAIGGAAAGSELGCAGLPCPDNRCLNAGEVCMSGTCQPVARDLSGQGGAADLARGGQGGDASSEGGGTLSGCGCRIGGRAGGWPLGPAAPVLALGLLWLRRRARKRSGQAP